MSDFNLQYPIYVKGFTDAIKTLVKTRRATPEFEKFLGNVKPVDVAFDTSQF